MDRGGSLLGGRLRGWDVAERHLGWGPKAAFAAHGSRSFHRGGLWRGGSPRRAPVCVHVGSRDTQSACIPSSRDVGTRRVAPTRAAGGARSPGKDRKSVVEGKGVGRGGGRDRER